MPSWSGCKSNFTILDTDDQLRLIKQLIEAAELDEKRWPARQLAGLIDRWKNRGLDAGAARRRRSRGLRQRQGRELYAAYQERLQTLNACDFGDLLLHMLTIFREPPATCSTHYQRPLPLHPGRRISGHQRQPSISG